ncbi:MAG TPA: 2-oxo-4-hydroxy-4-carboxy-5-ureidoimidazoline decarboxylase [Afifellaceae bacterium]|nr:2-oxo-4-hydroxy-4-carboxy-5-ureidoimidazoline decarboxylase [Afifellaceae bacterium]
MTASCGLAKRKTIRQSAAMSTSQSAQFVPPLPSTMQRDAFVSRFADIYEHSPWVAERAFDLGLDARDDNAQHMVERMAAIMLAASREEQLMLIRAHPDLAGKAAIAGELTAASTSEQAGAGLSQCPLEEFETFQKLNAAYKERFGFPFILAVGGRTRNEILASFRQRLENDPETEFAEALKQINRIARLRLMAMVG